MTITLHPPADAPTCDLDLLWLRAVLHDLGAPLQLLETIGKAVIDETTDAERRAAMLKRLPGVIHRITTRIHTLSDVIRDPAASLLPADYPVYNLSRSVQKELSYLQEIARLRALAGRRPIVPRVEALASERVPVRMCPSVFERIIENLVVNSAEAQAASILILVSAADEEANIVVLDDGPGFHPIILEGPKPGQSLKESGRGIGLAGVTVNVARWGGTLELSNLEDGQGARVCVCFPLASLDELEHCEAEEHAMLVRLAERMVVLPEAAR
jgi:signal transduction histidine kinase